MTKESKPRTGIVPAGSHGLTSPPAPAGTVVDMQDLMPVIRSFQDHMAAEQSRQRGRIRAMMAMFIIALLVALALPFGVVRQILRDQQDVMKGQQATQAAQAQSLEAAMREVADSSRALREELSLIRQSAAAQPPPAIVVTAAAPVAVAAVVTGTLEAVAAATPPVVTNGAAAPASAATSGVAVAAAASTSAPPTRTEAVAVAPAVAHTGAVHAVQSDLETQLREIEKAIEERQRQLKSQQGGRAGT